MEGATSDRLKKCSACGELKPEERDYYRNGSGRFRAQCKPCFGRIIMSRDAANPDARKARNRRGRLRAAGLQISRAAPGYLPPEQHACSICSSGSPGGRGSWNLDHDHETGKIRGWICVSCNVGLGSLKDSPTVLVSALRYLHRHGKALSSDDLASLLHLNTS